jgi:hypothetical protein
LTKLRSAGRDYQKMLSLLKNYPQCPSRVLLPFRALEMLAKIVAFWVLRRPKSLMAARGILAFEIGRYEYLLFRRKPPEYSNFGAK